MTSPTTPPTICRARADHPPTKSAPTPLYTPRWSAQVGGAA